MTDRSTGPRCGNNPNTRLTPGDRKAVDDFQARLALQAAAKPYIERAAWVDFDPLMEVIAATLWEHCARDDEDMPQAVCDDPRTIAAFAAAVAHAHAAGVAPATDQTERRDRYAATVRDRIKERTFPPGAGAKAIFGASEFDIADVVMAVADTEQAGLRRRITELESQCRDVDRLRKDWVAMRDRAEALDARVRDLAASQPPAAVPAVDQTALRDRPTAADTGDCVVAYRSPLPGALSLYCTSHIEELGACVPLTSEDLPDGGVCAKCGVDVLIPQEPQP